MPSVTPTEVPSNLPMELPTGNSTEEIEYWEYVWFWPVMTCLFFVLIAACYRLMIYRPAKNQEETDDTSLGVHCRSGCIEGEVDKSTKISNYTNVKDEVEMFPQNLGHSI